MGIMLVTVLIVVVAWPSPTSAVPQPRRRLPFELIDHILIQVRIGAGHPALLVYDPIQGLMLDADFVRRSRLTTHTGPELGMGVVRAGGAGAIEYDVNFVKDVRLQGVGATVTTPLAPVIPLDSVMSNAIGRRVDGLFGVDLIGTSMVFFDYERRELVLHDPSTFVRPAGYDSLPVRRHGARVAVPLTIALTPTDTISGQFVLDFGMGGTLRLTTHFVDSLNITRRVTPMVPNTSETGLGGSLSSMMTRVHGVRLGSTTIPNVVTSLAREKTGGDAHPPYDGLIGIGLLRRLDMYYHHDRGVVYVRRTPRVEAPFMFLHTGLMLMPAVEQAPLRVAAVSDGSAAARAGIRAQDVIESVDGVGTNGWTKRRWSEVLQQRVGRAVRLAVRRGSQRVTIELPITDGLTLR